MTDFDQAMQLFCIVILAFFIISMSLVYFLVRPDRKQFFMETFHIGEQTNRSDKQ